MRVRCAGASRGAHRVAQVRTPPMHCCRPACSKAQCLDDVVVVVTQRLEPKAPPDPIGEREHAALEPLVTICVGQGRWSSGVNRGPEKSREKSDGTRGNSQTCNAVPSPRALCAPCPRAFPRISACPSFFLLSFLVEVNKLPFSSSPKDVFKKQNYFVIS